MAKNPDKKYVLLELDKTRVDEKPLIDYIESKNKNDKINNKKLVMWALQEKMENESKIESADNTEEKLDYLIDTVEDLKSLNETVKDLKIMIQMMAQSGSMGGGLNPQLINQLKDLINQSSEDSESKDNHLDKIGDNTDELDPDDIPQ